MASFESKIRVLNDHAINKIAAGEVVENPSSVVKELVENALDAGAHSICVEILEGGRQLIRISDDGCGMVSDDALLCLERHATSKIRAAEDIQDILTMGFRGEAIPSIAAISKFSLLTTPRQGGESQKQEGTLIFVEGGKILSCQKSLRSPGTTIEVKALFFNVPVRRKFQRSPAYDCQEILKVTAALALAHPAVQFELISDQKCLLKTKQPTASAPFLDLLSKRIEAVLGQDYASHLIPIVFEEGEYQLIGYIGDPSSHKPNKREQHLFIKTRAVSSPLISNAIREGYGTMLPSHRYPIFVLHLNLPGRFVDVNVHPQKKEVRLRHESSLKQSLIRAVQKALRQDEPFITPPFSIAQEPLSPPAFSMPYPKKERLPSEDQWHYSSFDPSQEALDLRQQEKPAEKQDSLEAKKAVIASWQFTPPAPLKKIPRVLATLIGYCILEPFDFDRRLIAKSDGKKEGGLFLIDQKKAFSRIQYERLLKKQNNRETQQLLTPLTLQFSRQEAAALKENADLLSQMGFGLREFGESVFLIDAYPPFFKENQLQNTLLLVIQELMELGSSRHMQMEREQRLALLSARTSLSSDKRLSLDEAERLVKELIDCDTPAQCPLGKSVCFYAAPEEIEKLFRKTASQS